MVRESKFKGDSVDICWDPSYVKSRIEKCDDLLDKYDCAVYYRNGSNDIIRKLIEIVMELQKSRSEPPC